MNVSPSMPGLQGRSEADKNLVATASSLIPVLRSRSAETEKLGRLPDSTIANMQAARFFDMVVPKAYGGLQSSSHTMMDVVVEIARGDGSAAWTLMLLSGAAWMTAAVYPRHVVDSVFGTGQPARAAMVMTPRKSKTRRVKGGIIIEEGLWSFNSGIYHSQWDLLGIPYPDDTGMVVDSAAALIPVSEITTLNDWETMGLRGTGSTSVAVKDVFVPDERLALYSRLIKGDYAATHKSDEALYRLDAIPYMATKLVFPTLGIAKGALDYFIEKSSQKPIAFLFYEKQDDASVTHLQISEASAKIDAAELLLRRSVDQLDAYAAAGTRMSVPERARIWRDAGFANRMIREAIDLLAGASGGSLAFSENIMNRYWRDARVCSMHGGVVPETTFEIYGRVACGKDPKTPLVN